MVRPQATRDAPRVPVATLRFEVPVATMRVNPDRSRRAKERSLQEEDPRAKIYARKTPGKQLVALSSSINAPTLAPRATPI